MLEEQLGEIVAVLQKINTTLEALVEATDQFEVIVDEEEPEKECCGGCAKTEEDPPKVAEEEPAVTPDKSGVNYLDMDLDTLKKLCAQRNIPLEPRQRATTLAKFLEASDQVEAAKASQAACAEQTEELDEAVEADPFGEEEADPFVEIPEVTREQVTAKLQEVLAANGKACVIDILKGSGVLKVKDIPEAKLGNVYNAAQDTLS